MYVCMTCSLKLGRFECISQAQIDIDKYKMPTMSDYVGINFSHIFKTADIHNEVIFLSQRWIVKCYHIL